jgi:hypothetical protein
MCPTLGSSTSRFDPDLRERTFIASDETPVMRGGWWTDPYMLIVSHDPKSVDLSRVGEEGSCMFLQDHSSYSSVKRIGKIVQATIKQKALEVTARINTLPPGEDYFREVSDKCEPGKSIQFDPITTELIKEATYEKGRLVEYAVYKLTSWALLEISTVSIPAIGGVGFSKKEVPPQSSQLKKELALFGKHIPRKKLSEILR